MHRQFTRLVESPSRENYLAARDAVLRITPLPIASADLAELVRLLDAGEHQEVLDRIDLLPPSKVLSPRVHFLAAEAAEALGDADAGELERFLFVLCLRALLATGDGSQAAPFSVCHATDEYDLLETGDHDPAAQTLIEQDGRWCDVVTCADGRQVWFDVSVLFQRPKPARRRGRLSRSALAGSARSAKALAKKRRRPVAATGRVTRIPR